MGLRFHYAFAALLTTAATSLLAVYVSRNGRNKRLSRSYSFLSSCIALWSFWLFLSIYAKSFSWALIFCRYLHVWAVLIPVAYMRFVFELINKRTDGRRLFEWFFYVLSAGILLIIPTEWFITVEWRSQFGFFVSKPGPGYPLHVISFIACIGYATLELFRSFRDADGPKRKQLQYFLVGAIVGYSGGATNYLINYDFNIFPLYPFGNYTILAYIVVAGIAIVRYKFMDIEVVIKRTVVFAGLVGSVVAVVSLVAFVSQDVLARFIQIPRWLSNVFAAAIIAAVYGPLRNWLVNTTDRYLFQKKYDYRELLRRFTDELVVGIRDLRQLVQTTVTTLMDTTRLEGCSLLLLNRDTRKYDLVASKGTNGRQLTLEEHEPFITFLRETHEPIGLDGELGKVRFPAVVTDRLAELNARLCLPLHLHQDLIGVLCLGKKKSDEEYTKDDLDALLTLAKTLAIAVANAQQAEELAKTQAEAAQREKLAVIGTLSAGINHEICNPLGIVKAQCEAFLLDQEDGILVGKTAPDLLERTTNIMRVALKQIDRATAITQKLSNFAKPVKEPTAQAVSVEQEVDEVLLLVGHDLALEKVEVVKEFQPGLPPILADRRQLQEVLFNIIRNAGQAITPPGTITVRARLHLGQVRIEIADTGSGIPVDKLEKIYDPFFTTKEPGKGTGLGLFIVRQIVERNGGRIAVESAVGKGTTFFLDFPVAGPITAQSVRA